MILKENTIHQVLIFRFDEIPFNRLIQKSALSELKDLFAFSEVNLGLDEAGSPAVNAQVGSHKDEMGSISIMRLVIEDRRILVDIEGTSTEAAKVIAVVCIFLSKLAKRNDPEFLQPIVKAEDSEVVARLEFSVQKLLSPALLAFANTEVAAAASYEFAKAVVSFSSLNFVVQFDAPGTYLDNYRIALNRKQFTLGPRPGFPIDEQIYYSRAPIDTATHMHLLEELEQRLTQAYNQV